MYSPPRTEAAYKLARVRLEEDLRFTSRTVCFLRSSSLNSLLIFYSKIVNICVSLNEFPYIRYYMPSTHLPLGPLKPVAQNRPPPPPEGSSRWRTNLARGADARAYESVETDFVTKLLAFMVQSGLEEYKKANPDFGVCASAIHEIHASKYTLQKVDPARPRATLLITDRSMDLQAPFIHEFTYQAMANDLLPIEDGSRYSFVINSFFKQRYSRSWADINFNHLWARMKTRPPYCQMQILCGLPSDTFICAKLSTS
jgi:syntaxin-binding protein 1